MPLISDTLQGAIVGGIIGFASSIGVDENTPPGQLCRDPGDYDTCDPGFVDRGNGCEPEEGEVVPQVCPPLCGPEPIEDETISPDEPDTPTPEVEETEEDDSEETETEEVEEDSGGTDSGVN